MTLLVLPGEDVIGNGRDAALGRKSETQLEHERGFTGTNRTSDTDGEGAAGEVPMEGEIAILEVSG